MGAPRAGGPRRAMLPLARWRRSTSGRETTSTASTARARPTPSSVGARNRLTPGREGDGLDADHAFGHPDEGRDRAKARARPGRRRGTPRSTAVVRDDRGEQAADEQQRAGASSRRLGRGPEGVACRATSTADQGEAQRALDRVEAPGEVQDGRAEHARTASTHAWRWPRRTPRVQREQHQAAQRQQDRGDLGDHQRGEAEQEGQVVPRRRQHRGDEVEDADQRRAPSAHRRRMPLPAARLGARRSVGVGVNASRKIGPWPRREGAAGGGGEPSREDGPLPRSSPQCGPVVGRFRRSCLTDRAPGEPSRSTVRPSPS